MCWLVQGMYSVMGTRQGMAAGPLPIQGYTHKSPSKTKDDAPTPPARPAGSSALGRRTRPTGPARFRRGGAPRCTCLRLFYVGGGDVGGLDGQRRPHIHYARSAQTHAETYSHTQRTRPQTLPGPTVASPAGRGPSPSRAPKNVSPMAAAAKAPPLPPSLLLLVMALAAAAVRVRSMGEEGRVSDDDTGP